MKRRERLLLLFSLLLLVCFAAAQWDARGKGKHRPERLGPAEGNELLRHFEVMNPGKEVLKYAMQDLNNDGREDLVVIYRVSPEKNMMRVVLDLGGRFAETNEVPAPYSNQVISFRDIDNKPPIEIVVQGTREAKFGYAIFRVEGMQLNNLFGEGMEGCC